MYLDDEHAHLDCTDWLLHVLNTGCDCSQPLDAALKNALKGDLEDVVLSLLKTPAQYDAYLLKQAMRVCRKKKNDSPLISDVMEHMCSKSTDLTFICYFLC